MKENKKFDINDPNRYNPEIQNTQDDDSSNGLSKKDVNGLLKELKLHVDRLFDYRGDENYVSTCNSEYMFDQTEFIVTDGVTNTRLVKFVNPVIKEDGSQVINHGVEVTTSVMGAKWIIIVETDKDSPIFDLRVDCSKLTEQVKVEIINKLNWIKGNYNELKYVIPENPKENYMYI